MAPVPFLGGVVEVGLLGRPEDEPDGAARAAPPGPATVGQGNQAEGVRDHGIGRGVNPSARAASAVVSAAWLVPRARSSGETASVEAGGPASQR